MKAKRNKAPANLVAVTMRREDVDALTRWAEDFVYKYGQGGTPENASNCRIIRRIITACRKAEAVK